MRARIKATGDTYEITWHKDNVLRLEDGNIYPIGELDLLVDEPDWQQVHIQASIAAMHAELSNPNNKFMMCEDKRGIIVRRAVGYGDALTAKLKKRWKDEND